MPPSPVFLASFLSIASFDGIVLSTVAATAVSLSASLSVLPKHLTYAQQLTNTLRLCCGIVKLSYLRPLKHLFSKFELL
jgi:hypothetical protein